MTTSEKIEKLGKLYRDCLHISDSINAVQGGSQTLSVQEMEELLYFARAITVKYDTVMAEVINGLRAVLENEVHTQAGL